MLNALTIDLEDWPQAVLDPSLPITDHVVGNVDRLLALLDRHSARATFFAPAMRSPRMGMGTNWCTG